MGTFNHWPSLHLPPSIFMSFFHCDIISSIWVVFESIGNLLGLNQWRKSVFILQQSVFTPKSWRRGRASQTPSTYIQCLLSYTSSGKRVVPHEPHPQLAHVDMPKLLQVFFRSSDQLYSKDSVPQQFILHLVPTFFSPSSERFISLHYNCAFSSHS